MSDSLFDQLRSVLPATATVEGDELAIGGVTVSELAREYGTPVIVYDEQHILDAAAAYVDAFEGYEGGALVAYASKALCTTALLAKLADAGLGADVASGGELAIALAAGVDPAEIVVHGNNKSKDELAQAVDAGAGLIVVDAGQELEWLGEIAAERGVTQSILVRVNPDIEVETHHYIKTAHAGSKFGVAGDVAVQLLRRANEMSSLDPRGVHIHLGSQLLDLWPWRDVVAWLGPFAERVRDEAGVTIDTVDLGGGLGIAYTEQHDPPSVAELAKTAIDAVRAAWAPTGIDLPRLIVEPGRSIVGQAAVTLYTVGVVKDAGDIRYVNVDGGMSDNLRPMLYHAEYRALLGSRPHDAPTGEYWIAGKHCESGDVLIEDARLPHPVPGDLLVIAGTGAYTAAMGSNYNALPRPPLVFVKDGSHTLFVRRETVADLMARDVAPERSAT